ncbi:hypothetical protein Q428_10535 [Fervidicella metallireducens AeB]|uniref:Uncharacterized protein n=1 Tax=Fervidicella metallireducens AeB TaxID=1403537 RepID=A0A017RT65_9CLOT|nr:hypothetical protein Q428_10535 [Fervidicella metallireducens AeB]
MHNIICSMHKVLKCGVNMREKVFEYIKKIT